jgi:hypothetical protein
MYTEGNLTFFADIALAKALRVKIKSGSTTDPIEVELAGLGEAHIGTVLKPALIDELVAVKPRNAQGTHEMVAAGAISAGAVFYGAASGKISATVAGAAIGIAVEASTADGDIIEVFPFESEGRSEGIQGGTIATTGNTDEYIIVPKSGKLTGIDFSGIDALAASDTNYITFSVLNLGQAGAGSTAMLAATDPNTTKATGGSALVANGKRSLTLHGTAANLNVVIGDRLRIRAGVTGTLANTVTKPVYMLQFAE